MIYKKINNFTNTSIHKFLLYFILFTVIIPILTLSSFSLYIAADSLREEIEDEDLIKVSLLSNSIENYVKEPLSELMIIKEALNSGLETDSDILNKILSATVINQQDIKGINVTNKIGEILTLYPFDTYLLGNDVSGQEYFKQTTNLQAPYWSPTFLSNQTESSAVALSAPYNDGIITLFISIERIETLIDLINKKSSNRFVFVTDQRGVYIYHPDKQKVIFRETQSIVNSNNNIREYLGKRYFSQTVLMSGIDWSITIFNPLENVLNPVIKMLIPIIILLIIIILITIIVSKRFGDRIVHGVEILLQTTKAISDGWYDFSIRDIKIKELNQLSDSILDMSTQINSRELDLLQAKNKISQNKVELENEVKKQTKELRSALKSLEQAQEHMIESEKMAALGGMVAGVAHEINTPIGIIVTASSYLFEQTEDILTAYKDNNLAKSLFIEYFENVENTTKLILANSQRSANLIKSFKQVAVDQSSEDIRKFNIGNYLGEVLSSLHPKFKKNNYKIDVDCPDNILVKSYPGAFSQIITNLILNSIKHGFSETGEGNIDIKITKVNKIINVVYMDNGQGMSEINVKKIYEPFFTTKRGDGGSGLGMHIVYNLIKQKLNGSINCISKISVGTTFEIAFPVESE
ncbi:MAG: ATP-binding protein [Spirochaetaceae bacterium]